MHRTTCRRVGSAASLLCPYASGDCLLSGTLPTSSLATSSQVLLHREEAHHVDALQRLAACELDSPKGPSDGAVDENLELVARVGRHRDMLDMSGLAVVGGIPEIVHEGLDLLVLQAASVLHLDERARHRAARQNEPAIHGRASVVRRLGLGRLECRRPAPLHCVCYK
eukprot:scaffold903_cov262-Pinguiococcus_pyrenoidosus.AAC.8